MGKNSSDIKHRFRPDCDEFNTDGNNLTGKSVLCGLSLEDRVTDLGFGEMIWEAANMLNSPMPSWGKSAFQKLSDTSDEG